MRPRAWRKILWRDTQAQNHFRSTGAASIAVTPPLSVIDKTMFNSFAVGNNIGQFWQTNGGLLPVDATTPLATFSGDKIIRGGRIKFDITNLSEVDTVKVQVWLLYTIADPAGGVISPYMSPATVSREFDPTMIPDFKRYARVVLGRETILLPGARPWSVEHRLRPQKIDTNTWTSAGHRHTWMYAISSYSERDSVLNTVQVITSFSLSFAGDVVTEVP